jgi:thymidylate kinase
MESSGRAFFERVRAGYAKLCAEESERVMRVDGMRPVEIVHQDILGIVTRKTGIQQQSL